MAKVGHFWFRMLALLLACLAPFQTIPLTADQVRAEFVSGNYQVGPPTTWWADGSTTFLVRPTSGSPDQMARVLMVVVYPDLASAAIEEALVLEDQLAKNLAQRAA